MVKLSKSDETSNYLAQVIQITNVRKHSNADRLVVTNINGNTVITGLGLQEGDIRIFFPVESAISPEYLKANNEFDKPELNADTTQKGYFSANKQDGWGRVRCQRFRKEPSEGYIVPVETLSYMLSDEDIEYIKKKCIGEEFDSIGDFLLCKKHVPKLTRTPGAGGSNKKEPKLKELMVDGQFNFHDETNQLAKIIHDYSPEDEILITYKLHGSSFIGANVIIKRPLNLIEKLLKRVGVNIPDKEYGYIYSSGKPKSKLPKKILRENEKDKQVYHNPNGDFYKSNIWERAFKDNKHKLLKGISLYGELCGYSEDGGAIQGQFDYGCQPGEYNLYLYRITYTNVDGHKIELTWPQIKEYCKKYDLTTVPELYYGKAKDLFPELDVTNHWHENFIEKLKEKYLEGDCYMCSNKVPAEGIVVSKPHYAFEFSASKLKSFRFKELESKQLDEGILDLETAESLGEELNTEEVN